MFPTAPTVASPTLWPDAFLHNVQRQQHKSRPILFVGGDSIQSLDERCRGHAMAFVDRAADYKLRQDRAARDRDAATVAVERCAGNAAAVNLQIQDKVSSLAGKAG